MEAMIAGVEKGIVVVWLWEVGELMKGLKDCQCYDSVIFYRLTRLRPISVASCP